MPLTEDERYLAEKCFGYGRWQAKYWFVGLEERLDPSDKGDRSKRAKAFRKLNRDGLCDLFEFHKEIGEDEWFGGIKLQPTWGRLIWLLMKYLPHGDPGYSSLLRYQNLHWGRSDGDTLVTELSGLPADSAAEGRKLDHERFKNCQRELKKIKEDRIKELSDRVVKYQPELVIMYGKTQKQHWPIIAGIPLELDVPARAMGGKPLFLYTSHRNGYGLTNEYWEHVAAALSREYVDH